MRPPRRAAGMAHARTGSGMNRHGQPRGVAALLISIVQHLPLLP
jgi:hypothetical protein